MHISRALCTLAFWAGITHAGLDYIIAVDRLSEAGKTVLLLEGARAPRRRGAPTPRLDDIRHPRRVRGTDARGNGTGPARGEGLGRVIMMAQLGAWTRMWRWMWAGRGWRRRRDQLVVRSVHILHACGPLRRHCSLRASKANARGLAGGAAGEASSDGGRGVAGAEAHGWRRDMRRDRHVDGETDGGGAVETASEGSSRAWEPEGWVGERETMYLGLSTGVD
ncbi:hypothetical protein B0H13DRAFT_1922748 [Mycena leptocephala]|nr:hypothetical protein B0H13DRAFT_1922748 [Mycena leptocephala]